METNTIYKNIQYQSRVSFHPLLDVLKRALHHGSSAGVKKLYSGILEYVDQHPELQNPIDDLTILEPHREWMEMLLSIIFPPTASEHEMLYSVGVPFSYTTIYASRLFHMLFIEPGTNNIKNPDNETGRDIEHDRLIGAYNLILRKYCNYHAPEFVSSVHPYHDPHSGLIKYMELQLDTRYIDVRYTGSHLPIPEDFINKKDHGLLSLEQLQHNIPIEQFAFEGIVIGRVIDVTESEVISQMKSELLNLNAFSEGVVYHKLQDLVQSLIGLKDIRIGITPFFKVNGHYVFSELHNSNSLLFKHYKAVMERDSVNDCCRELFIETDKPIIYETIDEERVKEIDYLGFYFDQGYRSLILAPLKHNGDLWGILEIGSDHEGKLNYKHVGKLDVAIPLFTRAIEKSAESLDNQIDKVIKEQFTAVQPSVEWKFTEAAYNYIIQKQQGKEPKPEKIAFESVYPLYGAIDIRNSSVERSQSIQLDFIEQLQMAASVIKKAQAGMTFPLLQEVQFKIDKHISSASDVLLNDEETAIHDFLQNQVTSIFKHLRGTAPTIQKDVDNYFAALDKNIGMIYHHRKEFEESIAKINEQVSRFVDREQTSVQQIFPHYFERYVTDGVEFNIYIGQALAPRKKFDELYLRNMKMWQLTTLAKASRLTNELCKQLSHPMKTTQLILAHSTPISISFRADERKFDVDGAGNIRYEIIKKRIDKVHIKDTNERFTQPGKISIVYSQPKDAEEYAEYIEFLQNQKLLKPGIEHHDLEELQGVVGLKGLRVDVQYEDDTANAKYPPLSSVTDEQLLKGK
ncbi:MAG TPA: hypothetical protein VKB95_07470 [Chitinophagaceae bacterium]|nr:hypothetical protein [Chitinophagaceae bacterium]